MMIGSGIPMSQRSSPRPNPIVASSVCCLTTPPVFSLPDNAVTGDPFPAAGWDIDATMRWCDALDVKRRFVPSHPVILSGTRHCTKGYSYEG